MDDFGYVEVALDDHGHVLMRGSARPDVVLSLRPSVWLSLIRFAKRGKLTLHSLVRSSEAQPLGMCVEFDGVAERILVHGNNHTLMFTFDQWVDFAAGVADGEFDLDRLATPQPRSCGVNPPERRTHKPDAYYITADMGELIVWFGPDDTIKVIHPKGVHVLRYTSQEWSEFVEAVRVGKPGITEPLDQLL